MISWAVGHPKSVRLFGMVGLLRDHDELYEEEYLKPLKSYQYKGVDKSPISNYILKPYWNAVTELFPLWLAPNMITLLGFLLMIFSLALVIIYCPDLTTTLHPLFYVAFASCIWIYMTFDNCDGKQARRTGTSSPLGELFDHGCDALNCWIMGLVEIASIALGTGALSSILMLIVFWGFYLPTWETYHTGVLYLGYVNAPTEGIIFGCLIIVAAAIWGPQAFHIPLNQMIKLDLPDWIGKIAFRELFTVGTIGACIFGLIPLSMLAVYQDCKAKKKSFLTALKQLRFMVIVSLAAYSWLWSPYTVARKDHFILFHTSTGIAFGKMATKIILAHLTKQPFPQATGLIAPLFIGAAIFNFTPLIIPSVDLTLLHKIEHAYLWGFLVIAIVGYANWTYHVINSFCDYLDINCLTIKKSGVKRPLPDAKLLTKADSFKEEEILTNRRVTSSPYSNRNRS